MTFLFKPVSKRLPGSIIVGAQKCGTTSLYHYLLQHPEIEGGVTKEIHFFDRYYWKGSGWYARQFRPQRDDSLLCEATPMYLYDEKSVKRIAQDLPNARFIIVLRNPVDRAYSGHIHNTKERTIGETRSFREVLDSAVGGRAEDCIERSKYCKQLDRWFSFVPDRSQTLILESDDLFTQTQKTFESLCTFLEIDPIKIDIQVHNQGNYHEVMTSDEYAILTELLEEPLIELQEKYNLGLNWNV